MYKKQNQFVIVMLTLTLCLTISTKKIKISDEFHKQFYTLSLSSKSKPNPEPLSFPQIQLAYVYNQEGVTLNIQYLFENPTLVVMTGSNADFVKFADSNNPFIIGSLELFTSEFINSTQSYLAELKKQNIRLANPIDALMELTKNVDEEAKNELLEKFKGRFEGGFASLLHKENESIFLTDSLFTGLNKNYLILPTNQGSVGLALGISQKQGKTEFGNGIPNQPVYNIPDFGASGVLKKTLNDFISYLSNYPIEILIEHMLVIFMNARINGKLNLTIQEMDKKLKTFIDPIHMDWKKWVKQIINSNEKLSNTDNSFKKEAESIIKKRVNNGASVFSFLKTKEAIGEMLREGVSMPFVVNQYVNAYANPEDFRFSSTEKNYDTYLFFELNLMNGKPIDIEVFYVFLIRFFRKLFQSAFTKANNLYKRDSELREFFRTNGDLKFIGLLVKMKESMEKDQDLKDVINDLDLELNNNFNFEGFIANISPRVGGYLHNIKFFVIQPFVERLVSNEEFILSVSTEDPNTEGQRIFNLIMFKKYVLELSRNDLPLESQDSEHRFSVDSFFEVVDDRRRILV